MDITQRASAVIANGHPRELVEILNACIADGSVQALAALQRLYADDYAGFTYNYEFKAPAALALLHWRQLGIDAVYEAALKSPTSKNISIAIDLFSTVATGSGTGLLGSHLLRTDGVSATLTSLHPDLEVRDHARRRLNELMLALESDDDAALAAASGLSRLSWSGQDAAKLVFAALAARWMAVGEPTLREFRRLLAEHPTEEVKFQEYLEKYPQILDPMAYEVWPRPDLHGFKEPDFIVRRSDNSYLVVEIETPAKLLITGANQLSASATQAITQATQYRRFLVERMQEVRAHLPAFDDPDCLVVIGREDSLTPDQRVALAADNQSRTKLRVVGFDWLLRRAEAVTSNTVERRAIVRTLRMV